MRCGYYRLRYDPTGRCAEIPMQVKVPAQLRVRAYPVVERRPFVWVRFGDPDLADQAARPLHRGWATKIGVFI